MATTAFWLCIVFLVFGAGLGLAGVWLGDWWEKLGAKLFYSNVILFAAAVAVALVTKWLAP